MLNRINTLLYRLQQSGLIGKWEKDTEIFRPKKIVSLDHNVPITLFHIAMVFYLYLGGVTFSICVFIVEILIAKRQISTNGKVY